MCTCGGGGGNSGNFRVSERRREKTRVMHINFHLQEHFTEKLAFECVYEICIKFTGSYMDFFYNFIFMVGSFVACV